MSNNFCGDVRTPNGVQYNTRVMRKM